MVDKYGVDIMESFRNFANMIMNDTPETDACYSCGSHENLKWQPQGTLVPEHYICPNCINGVEDAKTVVSPPAYGDREATGWMDRK